MYQLNSAINLLTAIGGTAAAMFSPVEKSPAAAKKPRKVSYAAGLKAHFDAKRKAAK